MRKFIFFGLLAVPLFGLNVDQDKAVRERMKDFFFGLSLSTDLATLKEQLKSNPEFAIHGDPNRDVNRSITGSISKDKNLNPLSPRNQVVITTSPLRNRNREAVSFAWFIDYKLEDLASAAFDFERFKSEFKPYFSESVAKKEIGYAREEIESLYLMQGDLEVIIKLTKWGSLNHTVSIEFKDVRRKKKRA